MLSLTPVAQAFGPIGHRVVAKIAENHLPATMKAEIEEVLDGQSLAMISTWADEMRSDEKYKSTSNWHYINIEAGKKVEPKNIEGLALETIQKQTSILKNKKSTKEQKAEAIKWLVHLVGDLHQPLHAGLASDRGGNQVDLPWFGRTVNLHEIWDSTLLEGRQLSYTEQSEFLMRKITAAHKQKAQDDVAKWIAEDIELRELVYSFPKRARIKWEYDYIYRTKDVLDDQLIKAGLRLAHVLESNFQK